MGETEAEEVEIKKRWRKRNEKRKGGGKVKERTVEEEEMKRRLRRREERRRRGGKAEMRCREVKWP